MERLIARLISHLFLAAFLLGFAKRRMSVGRTAIFLLVMAVGVSVFDVWYDATVLMMPAALNVRAAVKPGLLLLPGILHGAVLIGETYAISEYSDGRTLFTALLAASYMMGSGIIAEILGAYEQSFLITCLAKTAVYGVLLMDMMLIFRPPYRKLQKVRRWEWRGLCAALLVFLFCLFEMYLHMVGQRGVLSYDLVSLSYLITIYVSMYCMIKILNQLNEREEKNRESRILLAGMAALKQEQEEVKKLEMRVAAFNHDWRHFIRMLEGMMAEQDYPGVEHVVEEALSNPEIPQHTHVCANIPINGVVLYYKTQAEQEGIPVTLDLTLPSQMGEKDWEIAVMLGIFLEDALREAGAVTDKSRQLISLKGEETEADRYSFELRVSVPRPVKLSKESGFPMMKGHWEGNGFGLDSAADYVRQSGGSFSCCMDREQFVVSMVI